MLARVLRIVIAIAMFSIVIGAFIFYNGLNNTAVAPLFHPYDYDVPEDIEDPDALLYVREIISAPDDISETAYVIGVIDNTHINQSPEINVNRDYVLVSMDTSDIHRGHLILVNKEHAFVFPADEQNDLVIIADYMTDNVILATEETAILSSSVINPLNDLIDTFVDKTEVDNLVIRSAFRSLEGQRKIWNDTVRRWGRALAPGWAAEAGFSEHHTGLAIDFGLMVDRTVEVFEGVYEHAWIPDNSHNFGFVLRYPGNKIHITETNFEPWHYRYVGIPHSIIMHRNRWVLEEYIEKIRSYTVDTPYLITVNGIDYSIYFSTEFELRIPFDVEFNISGNNIDGFIVTTWK